MAFSQVMAKIARRVGLMTAVIFALVLLGCSGVQREEPLITPSGPLVDARQLLVVVTSDWNAVEGELWRYERSDDRMLWQLVGGRMPVVLGRNGLAWGKGLHGDMSEGRSTKQEGDGRSPAGVFRLSAAFGYAPADRIQGVKLPYVPVTPSLQCVDDSASRFYNKIIDSEYISSAPDWNSTERMLRSDNLYKWGVLVDHNVDPAVPVGGSCIFLHIWRGPLVGTAGCTAMEELNVLILLGWLDPSANPIIVQIPRSEYLRLREAWTLPTL